MRHATGRPLRNGQTLPAPVGVGFVTTYALAYMSVALMLIALLHFVEDTTRNGLNLYFDIEEDPQELRGPALEWEYWDGFDWSHLQVEDETNHLRVPGMLSWIGPQDNRSRPRFGKNLYWLRGRLKEDGPPGEPTIRAVYPNAVWALHRQTVVNEPLGTSTGQPDQAFTFRQIPVLPGEEIEVRELAGQRANVEWRMLALAWSAKGRFLNGQSRV